MPTTVEFDSLADDGFKWENVNSDEKNLPGTGLRQRGGFLQKKVEFGIVDKSRNSTTSKGKV